MMLRCSYEIPYCGEHNNESFSPTGYNADIHHLTEAYINGKISIP
jgi:hypothetical protein